MFVGDAADEPVAAMAILARDRHVVADLAVEHARIVPIHGDVLDEAERLAVPFVMFRQVGGHLDRAVDGHVQRQLAGEGAGDRLAAASLQAEDAGGVVHRPGQQPREHQVDLVRGRIGRLPPGVVLHAARALAREPIRIGPAQAGVLDRFVRIDRQVPPGRFLHHLQVVARHELPVVPLAPQRAAGRVAPVDLAVVADVAGLEGVHAEPRVQVERGIKLVLVVLDGAPGLVVADQVHAFLRGVGAQGLDVEIRRGPGEVEGITVADPVAIPARIPAFHQHPAETMGGREVDVALGVGGGGGMPGAGGPTLLVEVHRPPHADVLGRMHPAHVAQHIGFVEVEDQVGLDQPARAVGDLQGAPGRIERKGAPHLPAFRGRRELRTQALAFGAAQPHAGVIDQRRLVDGHVQAVAAAQGERRVRQRHFVQRRAPVQVFVVDGFARRDPPGGGFGGDREFGQFVVDDRFAHGGLLGEAVAEAKAVVVDAEFHVQAPFQPATLGQPHRERVVAVAHVAAFAPGLLPGLVVLGRGLVQQHEVAVQAAIAQLEAELRGRHHRFAEALHRVAGAAAVQVQRHAQHVPGRFDAGDRGGLGLRREGEHGQEDCRQHSCRHPREGALLSGESPLVAPAQAGDQ